MSGGAVVHRTSIDARSIGRTPSYRASPEPSPTPPSPAGPGRTRPKRPGRHRPSHRAPRNTRRGAVAAAGVLVALGAAVTTLAIVGPEASLGGPSSPPVAALRPSDASPSPVSGDTRSVTCWDASTAVAVRDCGVPTGEAGLRTVFASLEGCVATAPVVTGKTEVHTCQARGYAVRYTRWTPGFDRFAYFDAEHGDVGAPWTVAGKFAGREWSTASVTADGATHWRWTATYRAWPFSVEVQASTDAGRASGIAAVRAAAPQRVGRG